MNGEIILHAVNTESICLGTEIDYILKKKLPEKYVVPARFVKNRSIRRALVIENQNNLYSVVYHKLLK